MKHTSSLHRTIARQVFKSDGYPQVSELACARLSLPKPMLARSGAHADHTTILAALRADGILDKAPSWFGNPAFLLQLDRMCAIACEGAQRRTA